MIPPHVSLHRQVQKAAGQRNGETTHFPRHSHPPCRSEHRLRNGLRVILAERHSDPVVAVMLFYGVGALDETEREAGLSHFLEHMMFKGSRRFGKGEIDRLTTVMGGQNNAFTGYDHTAYWFELASDRWETALEIEADRMRSLRLDEEEFDRERAVVLEELAMGLDDPWRRLGHEVERVLFPHHPYGRPIVGHPESLERMGVGDMQAYYDRHYQPANATLVVCGDVTRRGALRSIRKHLGGIPAGAQRRGATSFRPTLEEPVAEHRLKLGWDDAGRRLCMAWPGARVGSDDDYALDLIATCLTSGRGSRLQNRLVHEEGLALSLSSANDARVEAGGFWLFAECAHSTDPAELERIIDLELEQFASEAVSRSELRRARAILRASEAHDSETVTNVAEQIGEFAIDADWTLAFDGAPRYEAISATQLRKTAARLLVPRRRVVGWCLPVAGPAERPRATSSGAAR